MAQTVYIWSMNETLIPEEVHIMREEVHLAAEHSRQTYIENAQAEKAEQKLRRRLRRLEFKAGLITENGNSTICQWLEQIPSGCEEPDSESDTWKLVECGSAAFDTDEGWGCEAGHVHRTYFR